MKLYKQLHWILYFAFILSCARQTAPTGGPKDSIPPRLVNSNPKNEQTNFRGNSMELTFSEFIQLNNPKEQLIITPSIGKEYKINAKRQSVTVSWEQTLSDSTTYTFNFREAVQDVTERNPARKLRIAISTGGYIDSLSIDGATYNLLDDSPVKDVTVALQPYSDTFNIFKHTPTYFTKADEKGAYKLENLKAGTYLLYAWTDQNKNLQVDSKNERYGFKATPIQLSGYLHKVDLALIKLDSRDLKMTSARPYNTYFNIRSSKFLSGAKITSADTKLSYALASDPSNVILYNTFPDRDSLPVSIHLTDSIQHTFDTTLYAKFNKHTTPEKFKASVTKNNLFADEGRLEISFAFTKPIASVNFDSLYFEVDSIHTVRFSNQNLAYDTSQRILNINYTIDKSYYKKAQTDETQPNTSPPPKQPKKINQLRVGKGAFISIENDSSDRLNQKISPKYFEDLGVIIAEVQTRDKNFIIQLLDNKKNLLSQVFNQPKITFNNLAPADYVIRVIHDTNNNGRWDAGNYFLKQEPESVTYYKNEKGVKEIKLKANFELGPLLIT